LLLLCHQARVISGELFAAVLETFVWEFASGTQATDVFEFAKSALKTNNTSPGYVCSDF
jgi:hypothetical protein